MKIGWSTEFVVLDGERPAAEQLARLKTAGKRWIVVLRPSFGYCYVFTASELVERMRRVGVARDPGATPPLAEVLDLHEQQSSTRVSDSAQLAPPDFSWRPDEDAPSARRFVEIGTNDEVVAVGGDDVTRERKTRAMPPQPPEPPSFSRPRPASIAPPQPVAAQVEDEGTLPVRYPSIEPAEALRAGARVTLVVDLLREAPAHSPNGPLELGPQSADWRTLALGVTLVSAAIDFEDGGRGQVTIRRNDSSIPLRLAGRVRDDVAAGSDVDVHAQFWNGTRCCGSALRTLVVGAKFAQVAKERLQGEVQPDLTARAPDLTLFITLFDRAAPGRMHWRMITEPFDGLPPQLDAVIDLGKDPAAEAAAMFKQFANLERGKHRARIEGFGERLWERAPAQFHAVYWALHDHHRRPLAIQFVSDDPHLPWELMRPHRDGETHPPLALRHAVARWIGRWQGYMRNRLEAGQVVAIAPRYRSASARLSLAELSAQQLVSTLDAKSVNGTLAAMRALLESPPEEPVALLFFTGHGVFDAGAAAASAIKLEDGTLSVDEVARREVRLGERHGTVVFFNACEVGATGDALGAVGGWADAFLSRRFRAFIAPLWAIDEEDAAQVTQELMTRIVAERVPVGEALRDLRAKHGDVSPTYFSYLLYGDVTARISAPT
ncbi:MAG: CHAT domain-containing protein [Betaproteobacteria bacterium]|nr:CHAT domain-containing protein [Betaproteobacteria bacterium]